MKKTVTVLLAALLVFVMAACSGNTANPAVGTYNIHSLTMAGQTFTADELAADGQDISDFKVELKENGEFTMTMAAGGQSQTFNGTWTADGNKITMTVDGQPQEATLDGNQLTMSQDGNVLIFQK